MNVLYGTLITIFIITYVASYFTLAVCYTYEFCKNEKAQSWKYALDILKAKIPFYNFYLVIKGIRKEWTDDKTIL